MLCLVYYQPNPSALRTAAIKITKTIAPRAIVKKLNVTAPTPNRAAVIDSLFSSLFTNEIAYKTIAMKAIPTVTKSNILSLSYVFLVGIY